MDKTSIYIATTYIELSDFLNVAGSVVNFLVFNHLVQIYTWFDILYA